MNSDGEFVLSDAEFAKIKKRIYRIAGISLSDAKKTLVLSRLARLLRQNRLGGFDEYLDFLDMRGSHDDNQQFVNALTTNLTRFYREDHHFDHLRQTVGELISGEASMSRGGKRLRLWSAGCSTGQEPYTMAMVLMGAYPALKGWDFKILATDVDTEVLVRAAAGTYPQSELAGLSKAQLAPFEPMSGGGARIPESLKSLITFKPLNLLHEWPVKGPFDAIFCRNVTIYFDKPTQRNVFERFRRVLKPEGHLYIGHSENIGNGVTGFRSVGKTIYRHSAPQDKRAVA